MTTTTTTTLVQTTSTRTRTTTTTISTKAAPATSSTIRHYIQAVTARASSGHANEHRQLTLHYNSIRIDNRPRIKVSFLQHGQNIGFSLLFDTGSDITHIVRAHGPEDVGDQIRPGYSLQDGIDSSLEPVNRPASWGEGYLDVGVVSETRGAHRVLFGSDLKMKSVDIIRRIREVAQLYSESTKFVHDIEIDLTTKMTSGLTGIGLFGAGPTSHFVRAAGAFAYVGPPVDYDGAATASAGTLHILGRDGGEHLNGFCRTDTTIEFFPLAGHDNSSHWIVGGSMESGPIRHQGLYIVDTGASGVYVTPDILRAIKASLVESGASREPTPPGHKLRYNNCFRYQSLPTIDVTVGTGSSAVTVSLTPEDYILPDLLPDGTCVLNLWDGTVGRRQLLGIKVLSKLLTVFDQTRNRIGFCHIRS